MRDILSQFPPATWRIKAFFGTSENAAKTQAWIVISVHVLVAIVKKRLNLPLLSLTLCEQMPSNRLLAQISEDENDIKTSNLQKMPNVQAV